MKVLLVFFLSVSFSSVMADDSKKLGEASAQAVDCEKILAAQGAKAVESPVKVDDKKGSSTDIGQ